MKYKKIYTLTKQLLLSPNTTWPQVFGKNTTFTQFLRSYLFPLALILSIIVFAIYLFQRPILYALGSSILQLISTISSIWITLWLCKEYLCHKLNYAKQEILPLIGYSHAIFIIFYSIGHAFGNLFIGQIFILLSFSFFRPLHFGIKHLKNYQIKQHSNVLIVSSIVIIFITLMINQIIAILFGVPVIHV